MSRSGPKFTTAFNTDETSQIERQIRALATRHNRLIVPRDIKVADLLHIVVPPELRELALLTEEHYGAMLSYSTRDTTVALEEREYVAGEAAYVAGGTLRLSWTSGDPPKGYFGVPTAWVGRNHIRHDARPDVAQRIETLVEEWITTGCNYGLVAAAFEWVNNFCAKGDRRHARMLLPGLLPLIRRFEPGLARNLAGPFNLTRPSIPPDRVQGLARANQIISEALLLPEPPTEASEVQMELVNFSMVTSCSIWPGTFSGIFAT